MILGIDLGTTNSVVGYMADSKPALIPSALGGVLTPSVVGVDHSGEILVGRAAAELQVLHPERCASVFKRHMGTDRKFNLDGRNFTAEQLSSLVLKSLKADAENHLGRKVDRAVITVPAYFNDNQRKATIRAGQLAGFQVDRILNEPTAAAIAYGLHDAGLNKIVAVFDLGGGTFDISIVELFEGTIEVRASSGECFLGGEDFTRAVAARLLERHGLGFEKAEMDLPLLVARLMQQCERAKRTLSKQESADIRWPGQKGELGDDAPIVSVSRAEFETWCGTLLNRVELPIRRSLGDAKLARGNVDEVILVGGATRMPMVVERVTQLFGRAPMQHLNPDEVVALGAAVQAGLIGNNQSLNDFVVTDVCPFTLGVEIAKQFGNELRPGYFLPIIFRNTTIPVSRVEQVSTIAANQTEVTVKVFQGDSRRVEGSLPLGELSVHGIPRGPAGQAVDLRFTYDLNGVLEVEATIVATGKKASLVITHYARGLSEAALAQAIAAIAALKIHPREDSANRFVLKRAERLYEELPRDQREFLTILLDEFEAALERQADAAEITASRERLSEFLDRFDSDTWGEQSYGNSS